MYLDYFSLKRHPFRITPDPSLFFPGGAHGRGVVLDALVYAITTGEGILKVVGEVGSGKTMLCRMLEERLPPNVEIVYLANPNLSARDIIYAIAFELKLEVDAATDRLVVMQKLQNYLLQRHGLGANVVVFIEEAQSMPLETLEEVRLLSNLETHRHKLMQIVLFGQPELDRKLQEKSIRQLRERITHSFNLEPLNADEVREYLHFRLQTAGCPWPQLFSPKSERMLARASAGLTRRINILADKALLASYADPSTRQEPRSPSGEILPMVLPKHVKTAIADSAYGSRWIEKYLPWSGYAIAVVAVSLLMFVLFRYVWTVEEQGFTRDLQTSAAPANVQAMAPLAADVERRPGARYPQSSTETGFARAVADSEAETDSNYDGKLPMPATQMSTPESLSMPDIGDVEAEALAAASTISSAISVRAADENNFGDRQSASESAGRFSSESDDGARTVGSDQDQAVSSATDAGTAKSGASGTDVLPTAEDNISGTTAQSAEQRLPVAFTGLAALRAPPSAEWLAGLANKTGYTVQVFSALTRQPEKLQQFLMLVQSHMMLDRVFLCVISGNDARPEQWLVLYEEYGKLSEAQKLIESFPAVLSQYAPYARNLNDISCSNSKS